MSTITNTSTLIEFTLPIGGMSCASCVGHVEKALNKVDGVKHVSVNLATELATVTSDMATTVSALVTAVEKAGYDVKHQEFTLAITGMSCATCVGRVEKALLKVRGVQSVSVNLATELATVDTVGEIPAELLIKAIEAAGYTATLPASQSETSGSNVVSSNRWPSWWPVALSALLTTPLIIPMLLMVVGQHWQLSGWWQLALANLYSFGWVRASIALPGAH